MTITAPHPNAMASLLGQPVWMVTTTATALAGFPDTAYGASPFIFPASAFQSDGSALYQTPDRLRRDQRRRPDQPARLRVDQLRHRQPQHDRRRRIIKGDTTINKTLAFGEYIGQHNNGNHTTLYGDVDTYLSGLDVPAAIVDANGNFVGWSTFHVISADGGSAKHVRGYFLSSFESARLTITACSANDCPRYLGSYILKLTN